jgi:hypothetical protein
MISDWIVNVGLVRNNGGLVKVTEAVSALTDADMHIIAAEYHPQALSEDTLVAHVRLYDDGRITTMCNEVCKRLDQDCIAIMSCDDEENANLIGPNAAKWLPFNPAYFQRLNHESV